MINIASTAEDSKNGNIDGDSNAIITTNIVEVDTQGLDESELKANNMMVAGADNTYDVKVEDLDELDITVAKKEYTIVGDGIYIPQLYDDAPQWMKDLVNLVVDVSMSTNNMTLINDLNKMLQEFAVSYVPLNQYTQSILDLGNEDIRLNALIETLNSNFNNGLSKANAQIISLQMTKASKDEVVAQVIQTLSAQLSNPDSNLGATIGKLDQAIVTEQTARARSFNTLTASLEDVNSGIQANANATRLLNTYVGIDNNGIPNNTGLLSDIVILQKQNDGIIETTTGTYDVIINHHDPELAELITTAEPYATWKRLDGEDTTVRLSHIGDVYIKYSINKNTSRQYIASFKFIRTVIDATDEHKSTDEEGFTWALITDQAAQDAYNQALNAYDLADNKRRVFTSTPFAPIDEGDLWVTGTNPQVTKVYKNGMWITADTQVAAFVSNTYNPEMTKLQNQLDGKVESWFTLSSNDPKVSWTDATTRNNHNGDMWYQTDTKKSYYYTSNTHAWNLIDDEKAIRALADAATAQATADGKITSYYIDTFANVQAMSNGWNSTLKANNIGDLAVVWNDSTLDNNGTWRWNGTTWINARDKKLIALASDVTTLRTDLNNGKGTWAAADSVVSNTLTTTINNGLANVESKWAYNSNLSINGVPYTSGFGIVSNVVGNTGSTPRPPAGTSEFWVKADSFKLVAANQSAVSQAPFSVNASTGVIKFNGVVEFSNVNGASQGVVNQINNGQTTTINGGKITTGSITAAQIQANSISADRLTSTNGLSTVWSGGGLISTNFNGNVSGNIGTPTRGFRLSSNAAGTSTDPNIYGAYIKASYIESLYSPVPGTNNYGNFNYSAYAAGGASVSVVGPTYGSGYNKNRVTSLTNSNLVVKGFADVSTGAVASWDVTRYLQRSVNGGAYENIQTKRMYFNLPLAKGMDSDTDFDDGVSVHIVIVIEIQPTMAMSTTLEFYFVENLPAIGDFNTISYRIPNGTTFVTINN